MADRSPYEMNPEFERLIVRQLDEMATPDEELALNRELIRNPQARALAEEYRRIDGLAHDALIRFASAAPNSPNLAQITRSQETASVPRYSRMWWLLPSAMAAAVAIMVTFRGTMLPESRPAWTVPSQGSFTSTALPSGTSAQEPIRAASGLRPANRDLDSEVMGVVGEDGSIYWIEVDRTRTVRDPKADSSVRLTSGDM